MRIVKKLYGTVLVYTMVLVTLGVFMATVVLNIATELSIEYDIRNIEVSLVNMIQTKWDLSIKYAKELNKTWSGFVDAIGCPTNFTMSGTTARTTGITSTIRYTSDTVHCRGTHNGNPVVFYFWPDYTDLKFAQYEGFQEEISSGSTTATFSDPDNTFLDLSASYPLVPDGIDDNFDSDDYTIYSTGTTYYPDGYVDNDADSRLLTYGYILENSGLFNVFWSNTKMKDYIHTNTHNGDAIHRKIGTTSTGSLLLDINKDHRLILFRMNPSDYDTTKEFIITQQVTGTGQLASIWYLQDDMSLNSTITWNEYVFDFVNHDYALFVENTSTWALLYRIRGEEIGTGSGIYINPLDDDDNSIFGYLGSHVLIDDSGRLIWNQFEVFGLK